MYSFMDKAPKPDGSCCLSDGVTDKTELEVMLQYGVLKSNHVKSEEAKSNCSLMFAMMMVVQWITFKKFKTQTQVKLVSLRGFQGLPLPICF